MRIGLLGLGRIEAFHAAHPWVGELFRHEGRPIRVEEGFR
ncbi:hypothetical protein J2853_008207 [Streptosporangium lutulentum]|uniref:Gfo/Idh/MocA family oxidoreductase n=1 Tax=Streptosporangium lutulentum TaxID=1461250 RepID=A0ABT9QQG0_9ACTN|nr:hypothetical protein [Streptosporangium lutulentum]